MTHHARPLRLAAVTVSTLSAILLTATACRSSSTSRPRAAAGSRRSPIAVNQVAYLAAADKRATLVTKANDAAPLEFSLVDAASGDARWTGRSSVRGVDAATGEFVHILAFDEMREAGRYRLSIADRPDSPEFAIVDNPRELYPKLAAQAVQGLYLQRFDTAHDPAFLDELGPAFADYRGKKVGEGDAQIEFNQGYGTTDARGGHIDAGSNGWYAANQAVIQWTLLHTLEFFGSRWDWTTWHPPLPDVEARLPGVLEEFEFSARKVLGICPPSPHEDKNCGSAIHDGDGQGRRIQEVTTQASMSVARIAAHTARVLAPHDAERARHYWRVARSAHERWTSQPPSHFPLNESTDGSRGGYKDLDLEDDAYAALVELALTARQLEPEIAAGYEAALAQNPYFDGRTDACPSAPDWGEYAGGDACSGTMSLLTVEHGIDPQVRERLSAAVVRRATAIAEQVDADGFGSPIIQGEYRWGSVHEMQADVAVLAHARRITGSRRFSQAILGIFDHLMGRNAHHLAFVAGYGIRSESAVHNGRWPAAPFGVTPGGPLARDFIPPAYRSDRGCGTPPDRSTRCDTPVCSGESTPMTAFDALNYRPDSPGNWCSTENTTNGAASMIFAAIALQELGDLEGESRP